ncbi:MAG: hypothetical protein ABTA24_00220 [Arthrobacter sp.]
MEQKLRSALPARTALIVLGVCALFWLLSALGLLQLSASVPPLFMFFWLYLNALAALVSVLASGAAVAALLLHRRHANAEEPAEAATRRTGTALDDAQPTGLEQLLNGPAAPVAAETASLSGPDGPVKKKPGVKRRKR